MPELNIGKIGAIRQTWRDKSVREILVDIIAESPNGPLSKWRSAFREAIRADDDYFNAVCDYAFDNSVKAIQEAQSREAPSATKVAERAEKRAVEAREHAERVQSIKDQIILLNQEMPNGKRMRYCTGREMATFGAGYQRIAKMVGPNAMVGSKLNEQQVRKAMRL